MKRFHVNINVATSQSDQVAWETFVTHAQSTHYGADVAPDSKESRCCA